MPNSSGESSSRPPRGAVSLRPLARADRAPIEAVLRATAAFTEEEVAVALELIDEGLSPGSGEDYRFLVAQGEASRVAGYACYAPAPLTDGVYDLYWIAVDPALQGFGIGRALLEGVEGAVTAGRGRMVLIETASKPSYAATRAFYLRCGYAEEARVRDFYRVGDDKVVYAKRLR